MVAFRMNEEQKKAILNQLEKVCEKLSLRITQDQQIISDIKDIESSINWFMKDTTKGEI